MAKNGFKIFDCDTHVGPDANVLLRYMTDAEKKRLDVMDSYKLTDPRSGHVEYTLGRRSYRRKLGQADPEPVKPKAPKNNLNKCPPSMPSMFSALGSKASSRARPSTL